jgi:hypothetical protein
MKNKWDFGVLALVYKVNGDFTFIFCLCDFTQATVYPYFWRWRPIKKLK